MFAEHREREAAADRIRELGSPLIGSVEVVGTISDDPTIYVDLARGGRGRAREVCCTVLEPLALRRREVAIWDPGREVFWVPPRGCADPRDLARRER